MGAVEQWLDDRVGEPGEQQVLHRVETQPVIDAVDRLLGIELAHRLVELLRALQVGAEWLLDHDAGITRSACVRYALSDAPEQRRRNLHVEQHAAALPDSVRHRLISGRIVQVAVDVTQQPEHLGGGRGRRVHLVELERVHRVVAELLQAPAALGDSDDRDVEHASLDEPDQRRKRLELGQVAGRAEYHQRVHLVSLRADIRRHDRSFSFQRPSPSDPGDAGALRHPERVKLGAVPAGALRAGMSRRTA